MSVKINGQTYFRTTEVCEKVGVCRATLLRWYGAGILKDSALRDRRGWRLFTEAEIKRIAAEANHTRPNC